MHADLSRRTEALVESTRSLQRSIAGLRDEDVRAASLLPGWTRGHVLAHLARQADALVNLVTWARTGQETPMYPSRAERDAAIESQAGRSAGELVADVDASHDRLMAALTSLSGSDWETPVRYGWRNTEGYPTDLPRVRRREVEVHHVDLGLDYTLAHWPEDFVEELLGEVVADVSTRPDPPAFVLVGNDDEGRWTVGAGRQEIKRPPPALRGWLIGRTDGIGLYSDQPLPPRGEWI